MVFIDVPHIEEEFLTTNLHHISVAQWAHMPITVEVLAAQVPMVISAKYISMGFQKNPRIGGIHQRK